ncbi:MAG: ABC transporter substrate-binding protein [Micrococcales bacterium]|nr:ABC transporter substrate-binding protein [Micrococcales bacterium]
MGMEKRRSRARRGARIAVPLAVAVVGSTLAACSSGPGGTVVNLFGGASASGFDKIIAECNKEAAGKYTIVGNLLPSDADGQREQLVRRLAARDAGMDLLGMDVTWTAEFAEAKWIRSLDEQQKAKSIEGVLEPAVKTAEWKDQLYGIPKHTNVQILWYRKSLVPKPPQTWDELIDTSKKLKEAGKPYQIGFTAAQYEGYVVNVNNFFNAFGATFVNEDSTKATVTANDKAVQALTLLQKIASAGVTSASLSNAQEPEVFADLEAGRSAFAVNWPYVLSAMREANPKVAEDLGYTTFPVVKAGEKPKVTLGGMNYAISTFSKHPNEAFDAAMCLRNEKHQLQTAKDAGDPPVLQSIYDDPEFQKAYPMGKVMLAELKNAVPRPRTPVYQNLSTIISTTLSPPSAINPQQAAQSLNDAIEQAIDGKGILP